MGWEGGGRGGRRSAGAPPCLLIPTPQQCMDALNPCPYVSHPGGDRSSGDTKGGFLGQNCCLLRSAYFWSDIYPASGSMRQILPAIFTVLLAFFLPEVPYMSAPILQVNRVQRNFFILQNEDLWTRRGKGFLRGPTRNSSPISLLPAYKRLKKGGEGLYSSPAIYGPFSCRKRGEAEGVSARSSFDGEKN